MGGLLGLLGPLRLLGPLGLLGLLNLLNLLTLLLATSTTKLGSGSAGPWARHSKGLGQAPVSTKESSLHTRVWQRSAAGRGVCARVLAPYRLALVHDLVLHHHTLVEVELDRGAAAQARAGQCAQRGAGQGSGAGCACFTHRSPSVSFSNLTRGCPAVACTLGEEEKGW